MQGLSGQPEITMHAALSRWGANEIMVTGIILDSTTTNGNKQQKHDCPRFSRQLSDLASINTLKLNIGFPYQITALQARSVVITHKRLREPPENLPENCCGPLASPSARTNPAPDAALENATWLARVVSRSSDCSTVSKQAEQPAIPHHSKIAHWPYFFYNQMIKLI